jgi:hypothetical protein
MLFTVNFNFIGGGIEYTSPERGSQR